MSFVATKTWRGLKALPSSMWTGRTPAFAPVQRWLTNRVHCMGASASFPGSERPRAYIAVEEGVARVGNRKLLDVLGDSLLLFAPLPLLGLRLLWVRRGAVRCASLHRDKVIFLDLSRTEVQRTARARDHGEPLTAPVADIEQVVPTAVVVKSAK